MAVRQSLLLLLLVDGSGDVGRPQSQSAPPVMAKLVAENWNALFIQQIAISFAKSIRKKILYLIRISIIIIIIIEFIKMQT